MRLMITFTCRCLLRGLSYVVAWMPSERHRYDKVECWPRNADSKQQQWPNLPAKWPHKNKRLVQTLRSMRRKRSRVGQREEGKLNRLSSFPGDCHVAQQQICLASLNQAEAAGKREVIIVVVDHNGTLCTFGWVDVLDSEVHVLAEQFEQIEVTSANHSNRVWSVARDLSIR